MISSFALSAETPLSSLTPQVFEQSNLKPTARWGEILFFEKRLSANGKISCATCHDPSRAFTENRASSLSIEGTPVHRNSPTLINVALMETLTWANPVLRKLENQIIVPLFLDTPGEMALIRVWPDVQKNVLGVGKHLAHFRQAFPNEKGPPETRHLFIALADYIRTLIAFDSPYDRFLAGDRSALNRSAQRGRLLFFSNRSQCSTCHAGQLFSSAAQREYLNSHDPLAQKPLLDAQGNPLQFAHNGLYNWDGRGGVPEKSEGLYEFTHVLADRGKFRIPPLRNVARTPPYMHDGSLRSLDDVIRHYNQGGLSKCAQRKKCGRAPQQHPFVRPLGLTPEEQRDLREFLKSLNTSQI